MARFLILVKNTGAGLAHYEAGGHPDLALVQAMMKFNEELVKAGAWISGEGLHPSKRAARIKFSEDAKPQRLDGPFAEAKEMIGGFWMARFANLDAAVDFIKRCPIPYGELEIREIFDIGDPERPQDIRDESLAFAEKLAKS